MNTRIDVALILWNTDIIELMSFVLRERNLESCGIEPSEGTSIVEDLLVSWNPRVVVYDLHPPYDRSASTVQHLMRRFPDFPFVMTCADSARAIKEAPWLSRFPIFQKPYEMDDIVNTVQSISRPSIARRVPEARAVCSIGAIGAHHQ